MTLDHPPTRPVDGPPSTPPMPRRFVITFLLAMLGLWIVTVSPVIVSLPLKIKALDPNPETQGISLSILLGVGALAGILANPIFGRISDRTTWRIGMRRPWLIFGSVCAVLGSVVLGLSTSLAVACIGWAVAQIGINAATAVMLSLIPDQVPVHRRGTISGLVGLMQALAGVIGTALVGGLSAVSLPVAIIAPAVLAGVLITVAALALRDRHLDPADRAPFSLVEFLRSFWVNPRRHPDFGWAWISRFSIFMAVSMVLNYQVFYLTLQLGVSQATATSLVTLAVGLQSAAIVVVSIIFGPLSDRLRRRKIFVMLAALVSAVGLTMLAVAPPNAGSVPLFLLGIAIVGIGQGTYFAVDLALVTDVLPNRDADAGKDLGVLGLAQLVPQSLAPAIAPAFLIIPLLSSTGAAGQNYTALFLGGVAFAIISAVTVTRITSVR